LGTINQTKNKHNSELGEGKKPNALGSIAKLGQSKEHGHSRMWGVQWRAAKIESIRNIISMLEAMRVAQSTAEPRQNRGQKQKTIELNKK